MSQSVTINGTSYTLPSQGDSPPWGDDLSDILTALIQVANNSSGVGDILTTSFNIANNQSSAANVTGLSFDTSTVRSSIIQYSAYRSTNSEELSECGHIFITYKSTAGTWEIGQTCIGTSGLVFSITNAGQIKYTSTNMSGTGYSGKLKFTAKSFLQT